QREVQSVGAKSAEAPARDGQDAAPAFDDPPLLVPPARFMSVAGFASAAGFDSPAGCASDRGFCAASVAASPGLLSPPSFCAGRLSVLYQPPPLNTIAGIAMSLRG